MTFGASADGLFALDPVPRLITPAEWEQLTAGISQRLRALELFARDIYSTAPS